MPYVWSPYINNPARTKKTVEDILREERNKKDGVVSWRVSFVT